MNKRFFIFIQRRVCHDAVLRGVHEVEFCELFYCEFTVNYFIVYENNQKLLLALGNGNLQTSGASLEDEGAQAELA